MIIKKTTLYICEFCRKPYQKKFYCEKHELVCTQNPANMRPCFECGHLEMRTIEYGFDGGYGEIPYHGNALYCNKKEHFVYPPKIDRPYEPDDLDCENEPMPKECDMFELLR